MTDKQRRWFKRRPVVEPMIGHVKQNHGAQHCWLKESDGGDALHAMLCAAGDNRRWLLLSNHASPLMAQSSLSHFSPDREYL